MLSYWEDYFTTWYGGKMKTQTNILSTIAAITATISACIGVFYSNGGVQRTVQNIYGQEVILFGNGIYANDSLIKVAATKGTDIAIIIVCIGIVLMVSVFRSKKFSPFLQCGLLSIVLYSSTCLIMGVSFNRLFLLYLIQFGSALFAFVLSMTEIIKSDNFNNVIYQKRLKGTGVFMIIGGCSVLIWLTIILPSIITGQPIETIEVYTTEPTFALDLAIILPASVFCGFALLRKQIIGYKIAPVLLTLLSGVGICVIFQTIVQTSLGIVLPIGQLLGMVMSFVILGTIAVVLNVRLLKHAK